MMGAAVYFFITNFLISGCHQEIETPKNSRPIENVSIPQNQHSQMESRTQTSPVLKNVRARLKAHSRTLTQRTNGYRLGDNVLSSTFYRTIIDNNLFRPLGWTPPRSQELYRLTGTLIPREGDIHPKAFLLATATQMTHIVTIGDTIGEDTIVIKIEPKQVTLETLGQQRTLRLSTILWLNDSRVNRVVPTLIRAKIP